MLVQCLMGTSGRFTLACEALACFLAQTALADAELLIFNQHPIPLRFEHPNVRIVNEKPPKGSLRHIRLRMIELAEPSARFIQFWEDDDLYLPWHLAEGLAQIGDGVAYKPARSWFSGDGRHYSLDRNNFEGSWTFRADHVAAAPVDTHPDYIDHPLFRQTEESGLLKTADPAGRASYIYRWAATGAPHLSGYGGVVSEAEQEANARRWRERNTDFRLGGRMQPVDLRERWIAYLAGTAGLVTAAEFDANRRGVGLDPRG